MIRWIILRDGSNVAQGEAETKQQAEWQAIGALHRMVGYSADHALKWEGYSIHTEASQ